MSRKSVLALWIVVAFFVGVFHLLSLSFYLYWLVPWTDSAIHMLGGAVIFIPLYMLLRERMGIWRAFVAAFFGLFAVDIAWEVFEYLQGLTQFEAAFWHDTLTDTVASFIGAFLSFGLLAGAEKSA